MRAAHVPIVSEDDYPMHLPEAYVAAIETVVSRIPGRDLTRAADALSARYREPASAPGPLTDAERAAYLVVRAPATFAAVTSALAELRTRRPDLTVRSVLDLGAGPGIASWAALEMFDDAAEITLVERDRGFEALGREILAERFSTAQPSELAAPSASARAMPLDAAVRPARPALALASKHADLRTDWGNSGSWGSASYDLVLISYALGELLPDVRKRVLDAAWQATSADGALVIVEPGTPRHFQGIIDARTWLLAHDATIAAPCPHAAACPMAAAGDWCHFSVRVPRTKEHRRLKAGSLSYEDEKFSYLIATLPTTAATPTPSRIVRHPYVEKGRITLTRCMPDATIATTPIGRNDREAFKRARKARWGEVY
jgi:ribosomal protein RSM22 (predicted rRNA methylase)